MAVEKPGLYVVMGVAGSGKSTIGASLARALGIPFVEGDEYHPAENVRRMSLGIPLTDADRMPWLRALGARLRQAREAGTGLVLSCSALKRAYRDTLRDEAGELQFVFLKGAPELIAGRLAGRSGHFMPASLLESQFAILEEPAPNERAWVCDIRQPIEELVAALVALAKA
ncbi:MAG TPA: gluconokinase [Gemmatimonadaceae bacterium]|nr:gluconokinase [Gemmatimonadaceae bacterium]